MRPSNNSFTTYPIVLAEGGHPGTNTSTFTTSCTGVTRFNNGGTTRLGMPGYSVTVSTYARCRIAGVPKGLRIEGTFAVTAQSPSETRYLVCARMCLIF